MKAKVKFIPVQAMKVYRGMEVQLHLFLTSALHGGERSALHPGSFISGEGAQGTLDYRARWTPKAIWTLWRRHKISPVGFRNMMPWLSSLYLSYL